MESSTFPGRLDSLAEIRRIVRQAAEQAGLDKKRAYRLQLAVDEIAANIILYGYDRAGKSGEIEVETEIVDSKLRISLVDTAIPFNPLLQPEPANLEASMETRDQGGLGIFLARSYVDEFQYDFFDGHNRNTFLVFME